MKDENECCQICDIYTQCVAVTYQRNYQTNVCFPKSVCERLEYVGGSYNTYIKMSTRKGNSVILYCIFILRYTFTTELKAIFESVLSSDCQRLMDDLLSKSVRFFTLPPGAGPSDRRLSF